MTVLTGNELAATKEAYAVSAALGSPMDAPVGSAVYAAVVRNNGYAFFEKLTASFATAELAIVKCTAELAPVEFNEKGWLPVKCLDCKAWEMRPLNVARFWVAYREVIFNLADDDKGESAVSTVILVTCESGCDITKTKTRPRKDREIDLASPDYQYLFTYDSVKSILRYTKMGNTASITRVVLDMDIEQEVF